MKKYMNFSKLAISTLIVSSAFVACSEEITENTVDTLYTVQTGNISNAGQAVDLGLPSGTLWADKNVGASSESDNGILFIWGDITGKKIDADHDATYTNVTDATPVSNLFGMYKVEQKTDGLICDTTSIFTTNQKKLIDISAITDDAAKREAILAFVKAKLDEYESLSSGGMLEATLVNNDFELIVNKEGGEYKERIANLKELYKRDPDKGNPVIWEDTLNYYKKYVFEKDSKLTIDEIVKTAVTYYVNPLINNWDNNYSKVTDRFGYEQYRVYNGGTIGNSIKDITDPKKNGNLTFVPAYKISSDANYDAATANWGNDWTMPTTVQLAELMNNCKWEFVGSGYKVTGPNGNSIFLPAAGYRCGTKQYGNGNAGFYASGEIIGTFAFPSMQAQNGGSQGGYGSKENMPSVLIFQEGQYNTIGVYNNMSASYGFSIRPVKK